MYSSKEKIGHFSKLRNSSVAQKDLQLLKERNPSLSRIDRYRRNPQRYADDILYDLLDCCQASEIIANRGETHDETKAGNKGQSAKGNGGSGKGNKGNGKGCKQTAKKGNSGKGGAKSGKNTAKAVSVSPEPVQSTTSSDSVSQGPEPVPAEVSEQSADGEDAKKK